jgi:hypothetical protein
LPARREIAAAIRNMIVAILMVHARVGFFMNWFGNKTGE